MYAGEIHSSRVQLCMCCVLFGGVVTGREIPRISRLFQEGAVVWEGEKTQGSGDEGLWEGKGFERRGGEGAGG